MPMSDIYPVILSGGSGTRLWPLSRAMYPKQFIRFFSGQSSSFLAATLTRLGQDSSFRPPILLCNNDHRFLVREEVERAGLNPHAIVLEPIARNTAPAIAVAALVALQDNPERHSGAHAVRPRHQGRDRLRRRRANAPRRWQQPASSYCSASSRPNRTPATATSGRAPRSPASRAGLRRR